MKNNYCAYVEKGLRLNFLQLDNDLYFTRKPCCELQNDFIPKEYKQPMIINDVDDLLRHPSMEYFIEWFANNDELHPACFSCVSRENAGLKSARSFINNEINNNFDFNRLDIILGTSCNLACPFCTSYSSSLINKESAKYSNDELPYGWFTNDKQPLDISKISMLLTEFLKKYSVQKIKFIGGEPLLNENWFEINKMLDDDICSNLSLEVTTNGTIINESIIEKLSKTKESKLRISVDSIGNNYNFIRWPHTWRKMEKKLNFIKNNKPDTMKLHFTFLISIFNFEFVPLIEQYFIDFTKDTNIITTYNFNLKPLTSPYHYRNLPEDIISEVKEQCVLLKNIKMIDTASYNTDIPYISKQIDFFLKHRNMNPENVLGPKTRKILGF